MMRIIVISSIKGGVGKTTTAAHIGAALADRGLNTLLVDLDPQGHATLTLGVDAAPEALSIGDALLDDRLMSSVVVQSPARKNLRVAPAVLRMALIERQLYAHAMRIRFLDRALRALDETPDVVVVDTPPHLGAFTEAALHVAHLTLAPVPALAGSLQGVGDLKDTWTEMQDGKQGRLALIANMYDARTSSTNSVFWPAAKGLDIPFLNTYIPRAEAINQAGLNHSLVFDTAPGHHAVGCLRELASEAWRMLKEKK